MYLGSIVSIHINVKCWFASCFCSKVKRDICFLRYFLADLRLQWHHGVCKVWSVPSGGAETPHSSVRGPIVRLHGALSADVLPSAGRKRILNQFSPLLFSKSSVLYTSCSMHACVFVSRRRSCWTHFWMCWWQILPRSVLCGCHSCTDLLMLKMVSFPKPNLILRRDAWEKNNSSLFLDISLMVTFYKVSEISWKTNKEILL